MNIQAHNDDTLEWVHFHYGESKELLSSRVQESSSEYRDRSFDLHKMTLAFVFYIEECTKQGKPVSKDYIKSIQLQYDQLNEQIEKDHSKQILDLHIVTKLQYAPIGFYIS